MSVLVVDKPCGPSSFDVVRQVRRLLLRMRPGRRARDLKIGHGGTLDPLASGVLPICVGEATKLAPFLLDADKEYEATLQLGVETDTLDAAGAIVAEASVPALDPSWIRERLLRFVGVSEQVPPMFSALKKEGRPLYDYARAGQTVERLPRRIEIFSLELVSIEPDAGLSFRVRCSKGTYIRVLGADLALALGTRGHLTRLRRTMSGPFRLEQALSLAEVERRVCAGEPLPLLSLSDALPHLPAVVVTEEVSVALRQGKRTPWSRLGVGELASSGPPARMRLLGPTGALLAVAEPELDSAGEVRVRTLRVFNNEAPLVGAP